jgi:hypothetical protein
MSHSPARWAAIGLLGFSLAIGLAAQETPKLTYSAHGVAAGRVIVELAAKSGQDLDIAPELAREVLVISVKDVEVEDLLARIASVMGAEWRQQPDGDRRLTVSPGRLASEQRAEREARLAAIQERYREIREAIRRGEQAQRNANNEEPPNPAGDTQEERPREWMLRNDDAVLGRMLLRIDPAVIAGIGPDERLVFAMTPTRMQRPLNGAGPDIAEIVRHNNESARRHAAHEAVAGEQIANPEIRAAMEWVREMGLIRDPKPINDPPAEALLIVSRGGGPLEFLPGGAGSLSVTFRLYDAQGQVVMESMDPGLLELDDELQFLMPDMPGMEEAAGEIDPDAQPQPAATGQPIEYSQTTQELRRAMRMENIMNLAQLQLSPELLERIARPDLHDPLSFEPAEGVLAVAKAKNAQVVANLPDSMVSGFMFIFGEGAAPTIEGFFKELQERETRASLEDGWLTVWPAKMAAARAGRQDRAALARLIAAGQAKGVPSLDDIAAFAAVNDSPMEEGIFMPYIVLFAANVVDSGVSGPVDWNLLRFYGRLSQGQRDALRAGGRIPIASLDPRLRALVDKMAFGANARLRPNAEPQRPAANPWIAMMMEFMPRPQTDYLQEPTEAMPDGLPGDAFVTLTATPGYVVSTRGFGGRTTGAMMTMGPEEIAMMRHVAEDPQFAEMTAMMPTIDKVKVGQRTTLEFRFMLTPRVHTRGTLVDDRVPAGEPDTPFATLPAPLEARVKELVEAMRRMPLPAFGGFGRPHPRP